MSILANLQAVFTSEVYARQTTFFNSHNNKSDNRRRKMLNLKEFLIFGVDVSKEELVLYDGRFEKSGYYIYTKLETSIVLVR